MTGTSQERKESEPQSLGVIIPTLNEEDALPHLLDDLSELDPSPRIVVVDGGSKDGTVKVARALGVRTLAAPPGRAIQMNVGAASLATPWLLFLHADSRIPPLTRATLQDWLSDPPSSEAGYFRFRLDTQGLGWSIIELGQRIRERLTGLAYGDQGLLLSRRRWDEMGGIPELPIMEDVAAIRHLRRAGGVSAIPAPILTSPRRYRALGVLPGIARNAFLISLFLAGVPAQRLARWYPSRNRDYLVPADKPAAAGRNPVPRTGGGTDGAPPLLLVFVKAPRAGQVKTRLAGALGHEGAAALYRRMGRQVVDQLRGGSYRIRICFDPPEGESEIVQWLGEEGLEFQPQGSGDLGDRMEQALHQALLEADRACVVGTDAPDLDAPRVTEAFQALKQADAVFGPARDGGYYLLGLRRPAPALFREIPWSTGKVLDRSLEEAQAAGLEVVTLPVLSDVDRPADLPLAATVA